MEYGAYPQWSYLEEPCTAVEWRIASYVLFFNSHDKKCTCLVRSFINEHICSAPLSSSHHIPCNHVQISYPRCAALLCRNGPSAFCRYSPLDFSYQLQLKHLLGLNIGTYMVGDLFSQRRGKWDQPAEIWCFWIYW